MLIDFEGIAPQGFYALLPQGYAGLTWLDTFAVDNGYFSNQGVVAPTASGEAVGVNYDGRNLWFSDEDEDFDFASGYFADPWNHGLQVTIRAYDDGVLVGTASFALNSTKTLVNLADYSNSNQRFTSIDEVEISSGGPNFAVDDLLLVYGAPSATNLNTAESYTEDTPLNLTTIVVSDVDTATVTATLTLSNPAAGALSTGLSGSVNSSYDAGTGAWSASGPIANVNALLAGVTFTPALNFNADFSIITSVSDGVFPAISGSKAFTGTAVDDAATGTLGVSGTAQEGGSLTAALTGANDVDASITTTAYQWQISNNGSSGWTNLASGATLNLASDQSQVGKYVRVAANTTDALGGTTEFIGSGQQVSNVDDPASGTLGVSGTAQEGGSLTAALTGVSDADGATSTAYQWQISNTGSGGWTNLATGATLNLASDQSQVGKYVRVVATTTDALGGSTEFIGSGQQVSNVDDPASGTLGVSGTAQEGGSLTASLTGVSDADGATSTAYQWQISNNGSSGWANLATGAALNLASDQSQVGKYVRVVATTTDALGGTTEFIGSASAAIANVDDEATGTLGVSGTAQEGGSLTASLTGVSDADGGTTTAYQWQISNTGSGGWANLATGAMLNLASDQSQVGKYVRVVATTTDALGGSTEFTGSAQQVANVNDAPTGAVGIAGAPLLGQVLSADTHTLADPDSVGTLHYQWLRGGVAIVDASDAPTYTTTLADVGATISVRVSYTDGGNTPESVLSPSTSTISVTLSPPQGLRTLSGDSLGARPDLLVGTSQTELLLGRTWSDVLGGGGGDDWLDGGAGGDAMSGGTGNDTYVVDSRWDLVTESFGAGNDTVIASVGYVLGFNLENLSLSGSANINGTGNAGANLIIGNAGNNTLAGKLGNDTLIGGDGQDVFVFDTALSESNRDTIYNFIVNDDTIQLSRSVFSALAPGALAPGAFVTGAAALDANDRIIYNSATGALLYDADGSGAGAAVQFATLIGVVGTLGAGDFVVV